MKSIQKLVCIVVFALSGLSLALEHSKSCWFGCTGRSLIEDQWDQISFRLWVDDSIMPGGWMKANAFVDAKILDKSQKDLMLKDIRFSLPKSACKMHSELAGVLDCNSKEVSITIEGQMENGEKALIHKTIPSLHALGNKSMVTYVESEREVYHLSLEMRAKDFSYGEYSTSLLECEAK